MRDILLQHWGAAAGARLQSAAHQIDMELRKPKELIFMLKQARDTEGISGQVLSHILAQIRELEVVADVQVILPENGISRTGGDESAAAVRMGRMMKNVDRYRISQFEITSPVYNRRLNNRTVSLVSEFKNSDDQVLGRVEVDVAFDVLIKQLVKRPWWHQYKAYLLDKNGNVLVSDGARLGLEDAFPMRAFGTMSKLERDTADAIDESRGGMVFGQGFPPEEVSGFYKLSEAPWTMVIIAPGHDVLATIIDFRFHYVLVLALAIIVILFFVRRATNQLTVRIKDLSRAAEDLAGGVFGPPLAVNGIDEVEELTRNFNMMSKQLHQRLIMKEAIDIAREVQQNLLPNGDYEAENVKVSGKSIYCDETGGDYLDILKFDTNRKKVAVVVGDVVGHGIGAALLMTSVRAFLRSRIDQPGTADQVMTDVNRVLCEDTVRSGNFVTLFYLEIDRPAGVFRWIRAGHDPALVYSITDEQFTELRGDGIALGVDADWQFKSSELPIPNEELLILLASDGAWEVENSNGELFGKDRLRTVLVRSSRLQPEEINQAIVREIEEFRGDFPQNDDITLAVIKTC